MAPIKTITLVCSILATAMLSSPIAAEELSTQDKRKATYLLNFTRFAKWHDETFNNNGDPINICLTDNGAFKKYLEEKVKGRHAGPAKKTINIVNFSIDSKNSDCHLSYIVTKDDAIKIKKNKWLKVGDNKKTAKLGTAINFVAKDKEIRFEVYPSKLKEQGVSMSSELLKLATIIKE